jgi:hypothetical protein
MARRGRTHIYKWGNDRWYFMCQQVEDDGNLNDRPSARDGYGCGSSDG